MPYAYRPRPCRTYRVPWYHPGGAHPTSPGDSCCTARGRASARLSSPEAEAAPAMLQLRKTNLSDLEQQGKEATEPKGLGAETTAASAPRLRQLDRAALRKRRPQLRDQTISRPRQISRALARPQLQSSGTDKASRCRHQAARSKTSRPTCHRPRRRLPTRGRALAGGGAAQRRSRLGG